MKESQQKLLEQMQEEILAQRTEIEELKGKKRKTHWKSLLATGIALIVVVSLAAYAYAQVLNSISDQIPR